MSAGVRQSPYVPGSSLQSSHGGRESANLGDILERVLDRGVVIAGDIQVNLLDIELLTIKLRLLIASVDTAREMGIDWWEHDPWLTGGTQELAKENRKLRRRLAALEEMVSARVVQSGGAAAGHGPEAVERGH
ncbi:gas vesicle protein [Nonomuraea sp. NPDC052265]|uniref:gas vesicle protein n=1 Tax=Nonomuraea sp. NPDC052265 TaxID=3364374 RepID=UPI0037CA014C